MSSLSVIIPTLDEAARIAAAVASVRARLPQAEIIVADGGSQDGTAAAAAQAGARVVAAPRGRGPQCIAGAAAANGELLLFLHADTELPANAAAVLAEQFARPTVRIGTFRLKFDEAGWFLRASAWCSRLDSVFTRFGDQGIAIRRDFYDELGGFPPWPLFEDVELLRRARRVTRVWSFPAQVTTSARRFRRHGPWRQQFRNGGLVLRYLLGASPERLAAEYRPEPAAASR
ncbi:MAG: TIGR04283 family arsenosugar biosynthesis glycosyltransferase [Opitutae bacterium]|nr:TIGR04283 family arsenosugar biosynthesis glycosyltransferase [Opitutae bacterium]